MNLDPFPGRTAGKFDNRNSIIKTKQTVSSTYLSRQEHGKAKEAKM